jgi:PAS domain S-box-containing protein
MKILVADYDAVSRSAVASVLAKYGHQVIEAEDGEDAWRHLQADDGLSLVLLDWMLPIIDGPQIIQKVRSTLIEVPRYFILFASPTSNQDLVQPPEAGADDYLSKPLSRRELCARVRLAERFLELQTSLSRRIAESAKISSANTSLGEPVLQAPHGLHSMIDHAPKAMCFEDTSNPFIRIHKAEDERIGRFESERLRKDGRKIHAALTWSSMMNAEGEVTGAAAVVRDITAQKLASEELLFKTALLEAQSETSLDGILVVDEPGRIVASNKRFASIFSIPREMLEAKQDRPVLEHVTNQVVDRAGFLDRVKYLYDHCDEKSSDEIQLKDGRTLDRYSSPLIDSSGRHWGRVWYFHDVSERKRAEDQLRKLSRAVEQSPASVVITDRRGNIEYVNPKFTRLTGYSLEESIGQNPRFLKSGQTSAETYRELWATVLGGSEWRGELVNRKKSGELYWELVSISPVRDPNGELAHLIAVKEDITQSKLAEERLRRAEESYRSLVSNIPDVAWTIAAGGGFAFISPNVEKVTGYNAGEVRQKGRQGLLQSIHPDDLTKVTAALESLFAKGQAYDVEFRFQRKGGEWIWIHDRAVSTYERAGVWYADGLLSEITERKRMEMELRLAQKLEAVGQLAAGIAHEINTPIQFVGDNTRFLRDAFGDIEKLFASYETLRRAAVGRVEEQILDGVDRAERQADWEYLKAEVPNRMLKNSL